MLASSTLLRIAPYALAAAIGAAGAWWVQGVRIDSLRAEHQTYINDQAELLRKSQAASLRIKEQSDYDYQAASARLAAEIERGDVYRRCVAAGRCGAVVRVQPVACSATGTAQATSKPDATRADPVPAGPGGSADGSEAAALANECAATTLMLNRLQALIEAQPGY